MKYLLALVILVACGCSCGCSRTDSIHCSNARSEGCKFRVVEEGQVTCAECRKNNK